MPATGSHDTFARMQRGSGMNAAVLVARLVLASVFLVAAIGKLVDRHGTRRMLAEFGVEGGLARSGAVLLPLVELGVAGGLLVVATAPWAGLAAAALLVAFCLAIVGVLARRGQVRCNCFGALGAAPVGRLTLARNGAFVALAAVVVAAGRGADGISVFAWIGANAIVLAVAAAIGAQASFSWQLFRQNGRLLQRVSQLESQTVPLTQRGLPTGTAAPDFALEDVNGTLVTLDDVLAPGAGALLVFSDASCAHCTPILPAVATAQAASGLTVVLIAAGDERVNRARAEEHGIDLMLFQPGFEIAERYGLHGAPAAVVVDRVGRIASEPAEGRSAVSELLDAHAGIAA
jgi:methylamine dehydrogenase accessory protein MauD